MGREAALAVDVEHMPLMIHTVCGRSAVAAELVASLSRIGLLCIFSGLLFYFFPPLHKWKVKGSKNLLFMQSYSCEVACLILLSADISKNQPLSSVV